MKCHYPAVYLAVFAASYAVSIAQDPTANTSLPTASASLPADRLSVILVSTKFAYGVDDDVDRLSGLFKDASQEVKKIDPKLRFEEPIVAKGVRTKTKLFEILHSPLVKERTTLFCYCKLHGATDWNGQHVMEVDGVVDPIVSRQEILDELKKQHARLTILVTDSCSSALVPPAEEVTFQNLVFPTDLFIDLFIESQGVVDINSSTDQTAWMDSDGALFTRAFAELLSARLPEKLDELYTQIDVNKNKRFSWAEFFPVLQATTNDKYGAFRRSVIATGNTPRQLRVSRVDVHEINKQNDQTPSSLLELPTIP